MSEGALIALIVALLMAAAGMLLWDASVRRQRRRQTQQHLAERIDPMAAAAIPAGAMRFGAPPAALVLPSSSAKPLFRLPGWLLGAVAPGAVVGGLVVVLVSVSATAALSGWVSAVGLASVLLVGGAFVIWLRVQKMRQRIIRQLPGFLDVIVRLIVVGNSTQAAFQSAVGGSKPPLRGHMDNAMGLVKAGLDIDQALLQVARKVRIEELFLLASILGLGVRYGGRSDVLLERVAHFMRDHEEAEQELVAMSAETRLSAWILGLLPVGVGGAIVSSNGDYFTRMWSDPTGQTMVFGALGLQLVGALLLYRLARLS